MPMLKEGSANHRRECLDDAELSSPEAASVPLVVGDLFSELLNVAVERRRRPRGRDGIGGLVAHEAASAAKGRDLAVLSGKGEDQIRLES